MADKTQWTKLDVEKSTKAVQSAVGDVEAAFAGLAAAITATAKKKGVLPDGQQVKVLQARGGGYIFAYVDPRGPSSGPVAM
jgi:hypothetical protein